jgi:hypothetical protein
VAIYGGGAGIAVHFLFHRVVCLSGAENARAENTYRAGCFSASGCFSPAWRFAISS